jgi:glycosyltransferase involved in cell wall biosynthesis
MKIALTGNTMTYLSGQPLYCFEVARELKKQGHEVDVISDWANNELLNILLKEGVRCSHSGHGEYDIVFYSEGKRDVIGKKTVNIVHSEYECETPLPDCDKYVCIRPSIQDHIVKEHGIPIEKTTVIYNGVDCERFKPVERPKRDYRLIVAPCTIDPLRQAFFDELGHLASEQTRILIVGKQFGARLPQSPWITWKPDHFDIETDIAIADEVHGILLGRVNIEAMACGVDTYTWDTKDLKPVKWECENFFEKHDIKNVVKQLIDYANK